MAYALIIGDLEKSGLDLQTAILKANEFLRFDQRQDHEAESVPEANVAAQNDAALAQLEGMLKGVA